VLGLDAFQIDYGVVAAAAVLAVDGHAQLLADDLSDGADLRRLGGPAAGHARSIAGWRSHRGCEPNGDCLGLA
jgi:hypothetical protein